MHTKKRTIAFNYIISTLLAICIVAWPWTAAAQSPINSQFLPFMVSDGYRNGDTSPTSDVCNLSGIVLDFATLFTTDSSQQRPAMECGPILMRVAQERAEDMVANGYFAHTNLAGEGPNYLVREAGYTLANGYGTTLTANEIESIAAGVSSVSYTHLTLPTKRIV